MWRNVVFLLLLVSSSKNFCTSMRLYHSLQPLVDGSHYCIYRHVSTNKNHALQLVPYCFRSAPSENYPQSIGICHGSMQTSTNLSLSKLFTMFVPMDTIVNNIDAFYCVCSNGSLGNWCEFDFILPNVQSFDSLVEQIFDRKYQLEMNDLINDDMTCFTDLEYCTTYTGICLDWRQICDGIRDCVNGEDEHRCIEREMSECDPITEYRCRNGLCIPRDFLFDLTFDCPDFDDEQEVITITEDHKSKDDTIVFECGKLSNAHCDEHSCGVGGFSCGDGECLTIDFIDDFDSTISNCTSQRDIILQHLLVPFNLVDTTVRCVYLGDIPLAYDLWACSIHNSPLCPNRSDCAYTVLYDLHPFIYPFVRLLFQIPTAETFHQPLFICYDASICTIPAPIRPNLHGNYDYEYKPMYMDSYWCYPREAFPAAESTYTLTKHATKLVLIVRNLFTHCASSQNVDSLNQTDLPRLYRCQSGQLISLHRVQDGIKDCASLNGKEDEDHHAIKECSLNMKDRYTCVPGIDEVGLGGSYPKCLLRRWINDHKRHCDQGDDEIFSVGCTSELDCGYLRNMDLHNPAVQIPFQLLCNGVNDGIYEYLDHQNDTDETDCDEWPCNARYQRCDGEWNRPNGCDENNCPNTTTSFYTHNIIGCALDELYCGKINESALGCLSQQRIGDGIIDCLFGTDERATLLPDHQIDSPIVQYLSGLLGSCWPNDFEEIGIYAEHICDGYAHCTHGDDELLCPWLINSTCDLEQEFSCKDGRCIEKHFRCNDMIECTEGEDEWFCDLKLMPVKSNKILPNRDIRPVVLPFVSHGYSYRVKRGLQNEDHRLFLWCHRGILLRSKDADRFDRCLCPPSYYGSRCQYQRRRLTVSFNSELLQTFDTRTILYLIFSLLDEYSNVLVYEWLTYMPNIHSSQKYLLYLVYPHQTVYKKLFVRVDSYRVTKDTVDFFLAWHFPVQFAFLPVNRLAVKLILDARPVNRTMCNMLSCQHGVCRSYTNSDNHFCQCHKGWTSRSWEVSQTRQLKK